MTRRVATSLRPSPRRSRATRGLALGLLALLVSGLLPHPAHGAATTLSFSPSSGTYTAGSTFSVAIVVNAGVAINAAEATIIFPKNTLEAKSVSKSGSKFSLWAVEPKISNANGTVTFSGGLPTPGFTGSGGRIISITFLAKTAGSARLTMSGAQVLANDGEGTNVLSSTGSATYTISAATAPEPTPPKEPTEPSRPAPTISSTTHPDQKAWYQSRTIAASWTAGTGVTGYNALFDQEAGTVPAEDSGGLTSTFSRTMAADGIWYLHIRARYAGGWSATTHYSFRIDATAPAPFTPTLERTDETSRTATLLFATSDEPSGIDRYEVGLDGAAPEVKTSPFTLTDVSAGDHTVRVRAIDRAGNVTEATLTFSVATIEPPTVTLETGGVRLLTGKTDLPVVISGTRFRLRGFAVAGDTLKIVVRSQESVFTFPVEEIIDPNPIEPAPPGMTAWTVELDADLAPGEHTIHVSRTNALGQESPEAPVIRFRVVSNVFRIGNYLVPFLFILQLLLGIITALLGVVLGLLIEVRRTRERKRSTKPLAERKRGKKPPT